MPGGLQPHRKGSQLREQMPALRQMLLGRSLTGHAAPNQQNVQRKLQLVTSRRRRPPRPPRAARPPR